LLFGLITQTQDLLLTLGHRPEGTAHLGVFFGGDMGQNNPLQLTIFQGFAWGLLQGHRGPNHLTGLQDVALGVFANAKISLAFSTMISDSKGKQLAPR
jgi:hypothetical protein